MNKKESGTPVMNRDKLLKLVNGFRISRIILTAFELEIFTAVANGPRTADEIAGELDLDPRAADRLLRALCVLELMQYTESGFINSSFAEEHLVRGREGFYAGLTHSARLWHSWGNLTDAIREGRSIKGKSPNASRNWPEGFIAAMHERAMPQASEFIRELDLSEIKRTLDIGAGSGAYTIALLRARPDIHAVCFDLPEVIPLTRKYIEKEGLLSRVEFLSGDFTCNSLGSGYDLVLLSAVIHMQSLEKNLKLFRRIHSTLNENGTLVIQDFIMEKNRLLPEAGVLFALNMVVNTRDGDTFTADELHITLEQAGFSSSGQIRFMENGPSLMVARKS